MKRMKYFLTMFVSIYVVIATPISHAATTTASTTDSGIIGSVINTVETITDTVQIQIQGSPVETSVLSPRAQERITNLAANTSNRLDAIIARLQQITARLDTRIQKIAATGVNVETAERSLNATKTSLDLARADMNNIDEAVRRVIGSPTPKQEWQSVRIRFVSARDHIRNAHTELRNTINAIKQLPTNTQ